MKPITFTVVGVAQPQGSAKAFMPKGGRFPVVTSDNTKLKGWRQQVAEEAGRAVRAAGGQQFDGAVVVHAIFRLPRPKSRKKDGYHVTRPDLDKLARATGDALTGIVYRDDSQVVALSVTKVYAKLGAAPSCSVYVSTAESHVHTKADS